MKIEAVNCLPTLLDRKATEDHSWKYRTAVTFQKSAQCTRKKVAKLMAKARMHLHTHNSLLSQPTHCSLQAHSIIAPLGASFLPSFLYSCSALFFVAVCVVLVR